jgi:hypothetical protein
MPQAIHVFHAFLNMPFRGDVASVPQRASFNGFDAF